MAAPAPAPTLYDCAAVIVLTGRYCLQHRESSNVLQLKRGEVCVYRPSHWKHVEGPPTEARPATFAVVLTTAARTRASTTDSPPHSGGWSMAIKKFCETPRHKQLHGLLWGNRKEPGQGWAPLAVKLKHHAPAFMEQSVSAGGAWVQPAVETARPAAFDPSRPPPWFKWASFVLSQSIHVAMLCRVAAAHLEAGYDVPPAFQWCGGRDPFKTVYWRAARAAPSGPGRFGAANYLPAASGPGGCRALFAVGRVLSDAEIEETWPRASATDSQASPTSLPASSPPTISAGASSKRRARGTNSPVPTKSPRNKFSSTPRQHTMRSRRVLGALLRHCSPDRLLQLVQQWLTESAKGRWEGGEGLRQLCAAWGLTVEKKDIDAHHEQEAADMRSEVLPTWELLATWETLVRTLSPSCDVGHVQHHLAFATRTCVANLLPGILLHDRELSSLQQWLYATAVLPVIHSALPAAQHQSAAFPSAGAKERYCRTTTSSLQCLLTILSEEQPGAIQPLFSCQAILGSLRRLRCLVAAQAVLRLLTLRLQTVRKFVAAAAETPRPGVLSLLPMSLQRQVSGAGATPSASLLASMQELMEYHQQAWHIQIWRLQHTLHREGCEKGGVLASCLPLPSSPAGTAACAVAPQEQPKGSSDDSCDDSSEDSSDEEVLEEGFASDLRPGGTGSAMRGWPILYHWKEDPKDPKAKQPLVLSLPDPVHPRESPFFVDAAQALRIVYSNPKRASRLSQALGVDVMLFVLWCWRGQRATTETRLSLRHCITRLLVLLGNHWGPHWTPALCCTASCRRIVLPCTPPEAIPCVDAEGRRLLTLAAKEGSRGQCVEHFCLPWFQSFFRAARDTQFCGRAFTAQDAATEGVRVWQT